ncbi:MAG: chemotaxis protein CheY [Thermoplasmata archaeon M9B1D]|nr:MAG: chemotaxis protein CheY [Thermoplasmata archaeon M9B1D]PNX50707.1 MAG: chemotaxis protein CheY [Thermoplasmata archaeon M8B2D]
MKKILFVDDEQDQIFSVKTGFDTEYPNEYEIIGAESGKKCFELLEKNVKPDLILLDIMMPKMNGWEVFDKLSANQKYKKIPVIFLTARSDGLAANAGAMIADDYIEKPVDINELRNRIEKVLKNAKK